MSIAARLASIPFIGNIVPSQYVIKSTMFSRIMPCWSIRIFPNDICGSEMIVTETELVNARTRYTANADEVKPHAYGKFETVTITSANRNKKKVNTCLIYLFGAPCFGNMFDGKSGPAGYMFKPSELKDIAERTKRLKDTVIRPTLWQKLIMWFASKFCSITVKG